jgi:hypothetical protein
MITVAEIRTRLRQFGLYDRFLVWFDRNPPDHGEV